MTFDRRRIEKSGGSRFFDSSAVKGHTRCARGENLGTRLHINRVGYYKDTSIVNR